MLAKVFGAFRWIGKHWAISLTIFLVLAITLTTIVCWNAFGKEKPEYGPVFITVEGLGEGKDMQKREIKVNVAQTVSEIFSMKNPEIYEMFGHPLVENNEFRSFLGVQKNSQKRFHVTVDGQQEKILTQAYVRSGAEILIQYY